ncbi:MAG: hypothetical protein EON58_07750 [Alphaproteobacteria bacterium]|nr:MAG: hypothetical protein EON58_07750 [Alphaproteobacteria bacterium]
MHHARLSVRWKYGEMDCDEQNDRWLKAARLTIQLDRRSARPLVVEGENIVRYQSMFPIARHALAQVDAALILHDAGRSFVASVNTRVALEHALIAQWVLLTKGAETLLANTIEKSHSSILKGIAPHAQSIPPELSPLLSLPSATLLPPIEQICGRFDGTGLLYTTYRGLTGAVHLSGATLAEYVAVDAETGEITLHSQPRSGKTPTDFEMALGWAAVLSKAALEVLLEDSSDLQRVALIARKAGLPHDLTSDDRHPERQP